MLQGQVFLVPVHTVPYPALGQEMEGKGKERRAGEGTRPKIGRPPY